MWVKEYLGGCINFLDYAYLSFELGCIKPDKIIFEKVLGDCGRRNNSNGDFIFIDDSERNIVAARECGVSSIHYRVGEDEEFGKQLRALGVR